MIAVGDQNMLRVSRLRQSILKWAFEGKLVDQDSNDEPASDLLKRIKAEREATGKEKKKKREDRRGKRMAKRKKQRPLVDVLGEAEGPLSPEDLFSHAGFSADYVEVFYDELRREVKAGRVIEERPDERTAKLRMVTS
jgi:type I restriction enzyme S subunit